MKVKFNFHVDSGRSDSVMDADVLAINDSRASRVQDYWLLKVVEWVVSFCKRRQVGPSGEGDSSLIV